MTATAAESTALHETAGLVDFSQRSLIELRGDDRAKFLHNFCTNDVRRLEAGSGCEAFVLNAQGKILGHVLVFCEPDSLLIETEPDQAAAIIAHLDRYLIREQVELRDVSGERAEWLLAGPDSLQVLAAAGVEEIPDTSLCSRPAQIAGREIVLRHVPVAGPIGFFIEGPRDAAAAIGAALLSAGATAASLAAWDARRIEVHWPRFGIDISDKNLPQEVARDRWTISFTKGCYLGQETVARIDALGHVNKLLVGVQFAGKQVPPAGSELHSGDTLVGQVTSAAYSPLLKAPLALAYLRRGHDKPGSKLTSALGPAEVVALPL